MTTHTAWPRACTGVAIPAPRTDVLAYRADPVTAGGEAIGWDLCWVHDDGGWRSITYGGERITPPAYWWPLPEMLDAA
jgi:hypothetical protein